MKKKTKAVTTRKTTTPKVSPLATENVRLNNEITKFRLALISAEQFTPMLRNELHKAKEENVGLLKQVQALEATRNRLSALLVKEIEMANSSEHISFIEPGHVEEKTSPLRAMQAEINRIAEITGKFATEKTNNADTN